MLNTFELCPLNPTDKPMKCNDLCAWAINGNCAVVEIALELAALNLRMKEARHEGTD